MHMTYTLTVSSQGQVIIPSHLRKAVGIKPGDKLTASVSNSMGSLEIRLKPGSIDWVRRLAGTATGLYGDVDKYIKHERTSWDRSKPWP